MSAVELHSRLLAGWSIFCRLFSNPVNLNKNSGPAIGGGYWSIWFANEPGDRVDGLRETVSHDAGRALLTAGIIEFECLERGLITYRVKG